MRQEAQDGETGEEGETVPGITVVFGGLLVLVGVVTFVATGSSHPTALIPAALGAAFALLGGLSFKEQRRKQVETVLDLVGLADRMSHRL